MVLEVLVKTVIEIVHEAVVKDSMQALHETLELSRQAIEEAMAEPEVLHKKPYFYRGDLCMGGDTPAGKRAHQVRAWGIDALWEMVDQGIKLEGHVPV
ncbi:hypothetical protein FQN53_002003 [Emmonsiellopsis sp. PD_33]|nr:hypothetical protein FQN53_002003 [Emmonsiellopsis sp. PD_33]